MSDKLYFESWGRFPRVSHLGEISPRCINEVRTAIDSVNSPVLPRGLGRSYGDSCLNEDGYLLSTKWLDKFYAFDENAGLLKCEAGVTFDEILQVFVPRGWFLQVTPGTKFVTVGGAIANDIHGKNHHREGTIGHHVTQFELLRSDGTKTLCSKDSNTEWFKATIGGLGLTGMILWAELKLKRIHGPYIEMESIKFNNLDEFFLISGESEQDYEYTVSWLDCLSDESDVRGIFMRGNHSDRMEDNMPKIVHKNSDLKTFPFDAPSFLLSKPTIKLFNLIYFNKQKEKYKKSNVHYDPFFYPLDSINHWNRMYGKRGFLQWQCVVPITEKNESIRMIIKEIVRSKLGSFLVVLKEFGSLPSLGILSFPMPGITLTVDFPIVGKPLFSLLSRLDDVVVDCGGRIYPAKDACMTSGTFKASYSGLENFIGFVDPKFSSSFYRRVGVNNG